MVYSDGGPDHNTTFLSVKLAAISLFIALNLDMYVAVRCAPMQSYNNPAERCMSVLNIALQSVSLARESMCDMLEDQIKSLTSLSRVRVAAEARPTLKKGLIYSMDEPITVVIQRFRRLMYADNHVSAYYGATKEEVEDMASNLSMFTDGAHIDNIKRNINNYPRLVEFMETYIHGDIQLSSKAMFKARVCVLHGTGPSSSGKGSV